MSTDTDCVNVKNFCEGRVYDCGHSRAVITRVYPTAPLGVELNKEGSGVLNAYACRRLANFLSAAADWLETKSRT
jgi:hypothetical protein